MTFFEKYELVRKSVPVPAVAMRSSVDCYQASLLEKCYQCLECNKCHNSTYLIGCVGLSNKKYCILNNQLTKGQYEKALKEIKQELGWRVR